MMSTNINLNVRCQHALKGAQSASSVCGRCTDVLSWTGQIAWGWFQCFKTFSQEFGSALRLLRAVTIDTSYVLARCRAHYMSCLTSSKDNDSIKSGYIDHTPYHLMIMKVWWDVGIRTVSMDDVMSKEFPILRGHSVNPVPHQHGIQTLVAAEYC